MSGWIGQILPSLGALGVWAYWIIGAASLLEAFFVTGIVVPGTLIVDAGGTLVRLGTLDYFDLVWFVAAGAAIGGELSFSLGRRAGRRLHARGAVSTSKSLERAEALFRRRGGLALVIGRFLGPVGGFTSLAAALAGMEPRRFHLWNLISAIPYAFAHVALGALAGDLLARLGPQVTRVVLAVAVIVVLLGLVWLISAQIRRGLPLLLGGLAMLRDALLARPAVSRWRARHPGAAAFIARRVDPARFDGLTLSVLAVIFLYVAAAWADTALDFLHVPQVAATDLRFAELIHAFWTPGLLRFFGLVTQMGHWPVVLAVLLGAVGALTLRRRWPSLVQLVVALGGELVTVRLLKGAFGRDRPELSYFTETSGSFPSGHATLSVAFWGTLVIILWREKVIGPSVALVAATTIAFLVGGSRLYLIEHFLSDVVNGWLLGGLWLIVGLTVAEWMRARSPARPVAPGGTGAGAAAIVVLSAVAALWFAWTASPPRAVTEAAAPAALLDPGAAAGTPDLPLTTETLTGDAVTPVALIVTAPDLAAATQAWIAAGWTTQDLPPLSALLHMAIADWTGRPSAETPLLPVFWQGRPQARGLRSPDGDTELRLWQAEARTASGAAIFVAALSPAREGGAPWSVAGARDAAAPDAPTVAAWPAASGTAINGRRWSWDGRVAFVSE